MTAVVWLGVMLVGGAGAVARFLIDGRVSARAGRSFPYGTMTVNLSGAVLLGAVTGLALSNNVTLLAGTAAIGSFTTFSTWMFESQRLAEDRQIPGLAANIAVSLVAGLAAAALGRFLGGAL